MIGPVILGVGDIAVRIGQKKESVYTMSARGQLPPEDFRINAGRTPVWLTETIDNWNDERNDK